jgi:hypothetical protein
MIKIKSNARNAGQDLNAFSPIYVGQVAKF